LIAEFVKDKKTKEEIERSREKLHHHENKETIAIEGYDLPKEETAAKKKSEKESIKIEIPEELKPHLNVIGNIDLNKNNKKVQEPRKNKSKPNRNNRRKRTCSGSIGHRTTKQRTSIGEDRNRNRKYSSRKRIIMKRGKMKSRSRQVKTRPAKMKKK